MTDGLSPGPLTVTKYKTVTGPTNMVVLLCVRVSMSPLWKGHHHNIS